MLKIDLTLSGQSTQERYMLRSAHLCILLTSLTLMIILYFLALEQSSTLLISEQFIQLQQSQSTTSLIATFLTFILSLNVILPVPASLASVYAASSLHHLIAPTVIWLGLTLSSLIGYGVGTKIHQAFLLNKNTPPLSYKTEKNTRRISSIALVLLRAIPVLSEVSIIAAGIMRFPIKKFLLLVSLTNAGLAVAYTYLGALASKSESIIFLIISGIVLPTGVIFIYKAFQLCFRFYLLNNQHNAKEQNNKISKLTSSHINSFPKEVTPPHKHYAVEFTQDLWTISSPHDSPLLMLLNKKVRQHKQSTFCCIIDNNVNKKQPDLQHRIQVFFNAFSHLNLISNPIITSVQKCSPPSQMNKKIDHLLSQNALNEHSIIIAIGGESLFAALSVTINTFYPKLSFIRVPSTVSSQSYTSIGSENKITTSNENGHIAPFTKLLAVFNDSSLLSSLKTQDKHAGLVLVIKMAVLKDAQFFNWLEVNAKALFQCRPKEMQYAIQRCAQLKLQHATHSTSFLNEEAISPLEYGHWSAYQLDKLPTTRLNYAQKLTIGICLDACYSTRVGLLNKESTIRLLNLFKKLGFTLWHDELLNKSCGKLTLLEELEDVKTKRGSRLSIPLLTSIGYSKTVHNINHDMMTEAVKDLHQWHQQTLHLFPEQKGIA